MLAVTGHFITLVMYYDCTVSQALQQWLPDDIQDCKAHTLHSSHFCSQACVVSYLFTVFSERIFWELLWIRGIAP